MGDGRRDERLGMWPDDLTSSEDGRGRKIEGEISLVDSARRDFCIPSNLHVRPGLEEPVAYKSHRDS